MYFSPSGKRLFGQTAETHESAKVNTRLKYVLEFRMNRYTSLALDKVLFSSKKYCYFSNFSTKMYTIGIIRSNLVFFLFLNKNVCCRYWYHKHFLEK